MLFLKLNKLNLIQKTVHYPWYAYSSKSETDNYVILSVISFFQILIMKIPAFQYLSRSNFYNNSSLIGCRCSDGSSSAGLYVPPALEYLNHFGMMGTDWIENPDQNIYRCWFPCTNCSLQQGKPEVTIWILQFTTTGYLVQW